MVLNFFAPKLARHRVKRFMDNQNVVHIVEAGSKKEHLQVIALSTFESCLWQSIRLDMEWIPRSLNDKADYVSQTQGFDDWSINSQFSPGLTQCGVLIQWTVLLMLTTLNCQKFYSRYWCPSTAAVDAFKMNWAGDVNWWIPPISLIGHVLKHSEACNATGSLVPVWKSAPFWPLLCLDGSHLASFVHQWHFNLHYLSQGVEIVLVKPWLQTL